MQLMTKIEEKLPQINVEIKKHLKEYEGQFEKLGDAIPEES